MHPTSQYGLKADKKELIISSNFPITHLLSPRVFETQSGMLGAVMELEGVPFDTERHEVLNHYHHIWHHAIKMLNDNIALHVTVHRFKENLSLDGSFPDSFTQSLNDKYHQKCGQKSAYKNRLYVTVIYKGVGLGKANHLLATFKKMSEKTVKAARNHHREKQYHALLDTLHQLTLALKPFSPRVLGEDDDNKGYSELLHFLGLAVNGGNSLAFAMPQQVSSIQTATHDNKVTYPHEHIGQYVSGYRLLFGRAIQFENGLDEERRFASMVSIKQYVSDSHSLMLSPLLHVNSEFIMTHTFAPIAKSISAERIKKHTKKLENVDDDGVSQIKQLHEVRDDIASDRLLMGYHHHTVMVLADDLSRLQEQTKDVMQCYSHSGIVAVNEDIGLEPCFWSQIPTNFKFIARSALITSHNFVDLCPLHNYRMGYRDKNHLGSAVTLLETPARTPYFFNYHLAQEGSNKNHVTSGHTLILGATGSGKTALMTFLDAQASRYHGRTFVFDRKRGFELYIRACGGYYTQLSPNHRDVAFNPFQLTDTPVNRKFCQDWLTQLVKEEGESHIEQTSLMQLKECVDYAFDKLHPAHRTLSHATQFLPISFPRWVHLRRWLKASGKYGEGEYAYLFDNEVDTFSIHRKMGFDMTHFLDKEPSSVRAAVMMYIMHRLELAMDGTLLSIYMDEGWQYLKDAYWLKKAEEMLASFRSKNAHLVFATQTPETVIGSPIHPIILSNVATQIIFPNYKANRVDYVDGFKLTDEEFETIRDTDNTQHLFLVKQGNQSSLCRLDLSHHADVLSVLAPSEKEVLLAEQLRREMGEDSQGWLPVFLDRKNTP